MKIFPFKEIFSFGQIKEAVKCYFLQIPSPYSKSSEYKMKTPHFINLSITGNPTIITLTYWRDRSNFTNQAPPKLAKRLGYYTHYTYSFPEKTTKQNKTLFKNNANQNFLGHSALDLIKGRKLDFALQSPWNFELSRSMPNKFSEIIRTVEIHSCSLPSFASMCKWHIQNPDVM